MHCIWIWTTADVLQTKVGKDKHFQGALKQHILNAVSAAFAEYWEFFMKVYAKQH